MANQTLNKNVSVIENIPRSRSFWEDALRAILRDRLTILSIFILLLLTLGCLILPPLVEDWTDTGITTNSDPRRRTEMRWPRVTDCSRRS
jgi:hypothetical protein